MKSSAIRRLVTGHQRSDLVTEFCFGQEGEFPHQAPGRC